MDGKTVIVFSDSHGQRAVLQDIKAHYPDALFFHNGDSELSADAAIWDSIQVVGGNCDAQGIYPDDLITEVAGLRIAQTHGHRYHINLMWDNLIAFAQKKTADICLYGHLHRPAIWQEAGILFLNPGSVSQPRGQIKEPLYAKVLINQKTIQVDFMRLDHTVYPDLSQTFQR